VFDSSPELRVSAAERSAPEPDRRRPNPPQRKKKSARGGGGKGRSLVGRVTYWALVAGLWVVIGGVGAIAYVGAHLPPDPVAGNPQASAFDPDQRCQRQAAGAPRRSAGEVISLKDLPRMSRAFVAIEDRRFYEHYGVDPLGIGAP